MQGMVRGEIETALAQIERQIAEAEVHVARHRKVGPSKLLEHLEDAQRRRIERQNILKRALLEADGAPST